MQKLKKLTPIILLFIIMLISWNTIDFNSIISHKQDIVEYATQNIVFASLIFVFSYFISVALSLPIATALTLLAGIIFGPYLGTMLVVLGATLGATTIFLIIKLTSDSFDLLAKYKKSKHLLTLQKNIKKDAVSYLLFARLVPLFPFVLVNIAPATVGIKASTFISTTFIGIIPGSFIYTYLGYQSGQLENIGDLVSIEMILALTLLGLFSLSPILIKRIKKHD